MEFTCNSIKIKEDGDEQLLVLDKYAREYKKEFQKLSYLRSMGDITR